MKTLAIAILSCAFLLGCEATSRPWVGEGEPIVRPGTYKRTIEFHFYADEHQLQTAWLNDPRISAERKRFVPTAYAFPGSNEIHTLLPRAGDPFWICTLGHEALHVLTHARSGHWHSPLLGGQECFSYEVAR